MELSFLALLYPWVQRFLEIRILTKRHRRPRRIGQLPAAFRLLAAAKFNLSMRGMQPLREWGQ